MLSRVRIAVDEVGGEQRDDARDQQVEGGPALAGVDGEPDSCGEQEDVAHRIADRDDLGQQRERLVVDVGGDQHDPRDQRQPQGHDHRVDGGRTVAALVAPAHEHDQSGHQHRVDRQVDRVAGRRERNVRAEQLGVAVGVKVAQPEQREPGGETPPGEARLRLVDPDAGDDANHAVQAEAVDHRAAALERGHEHVQPAHERPEQQERQPHAAAVKRGCECEGRHGRLVGVTRQARGGA